MHRSLARAVGLTIAVLAMTLGTLTAPTSAAPPSAKRVVTPTDLYAAGTQFDAGRKIRVHGFTTPRWRNVVLQERVGGSWKKVAAKRSKRGKFAFQVTLGEGANKYRAVSKRRVIKRKKAPRRVVLVKTVSQAVSVTGVPVVVEPPVTVIVDDPSIDATAAFMVRLAVNEHRQSIGAEKLMNNSCLADFAMAHSRMMAETEIFQHSGHPLFGDDVPTASEVCPTASPWRNEALALVYATSPEEAAASALQAWKDSPAHRAIIEATDGTAWQTGIGVARTSDGYWWVTLVRASAD